MLTNYGQPPRVLCKHKHIDHGTTRTLYLNTQRHVVAYCDDCGKQVFLDSDQPGVIPLRMRIMNWIKKHIGR